MVLINRESLSIYLYFVQWICLTSAVLKKKKTWRKIRSQSKEKQNKVSDAVCSTVINLTLSALIIHWHYSVLLCWNLREFRFCREKFWLRFKTLFSEHGMRLHSLSSWSEITKASGKLCERNKHWLRPTSVNSLKLNKETSYTKNDIYFVEFYTCSMVSSDPV